jgi:uncharacterized membrane protein YhaH (DUF805 family)
MQEFRWFSAQGRINRSNFIIQYVLTLGVYLIFNATTEWFRNWFFIIPALAVFLAVNISMICTAIKRLHDLGHSGFMYLLVLVPLLNIIFMLYLAIRPAKDWKNDYGLNPLLPTTRCPACLRAGIHPPGRFICSTCGQRFEIHQDFAITQFSS